MASICVRIWPKHDNQIMAVDISEEKLEPILPYVVSAKIGDCTNEAVLKSLGLGILISALSALEIISKTVWRLPVMIRRWGQGSLSARQTAISMPGCC